VKNDNYSIPEYMATEVLELASRYYAETENSYSLSELQQAGSDVQIPPELIEKAIEAVQEKRRLEAAQQAQAQQQQQKLKMVAAGLTMAIALWGISAYNSLSGSQQTVEAKWAQVENQLQRRADLIPSLVTVVKMQTAAEQEIVAMLVRSRENYLQAGDFSQKETAIGEINTAIRQFNQYAATNIQLKSSQAFQNLSYELAGTENRIAVERMRYNQAVQAYNQKVKAFPNSLIARLTGFKPQPFFAAENTEKQELPAIK
jgi:LemA protein